MNVAEEGRARWLELHTYAFNYPDNPTATDQQQARRWLDYFARRIPSFGCSCQDHWQLMVMTCPPDLSSRSAFYWWTVAAHDSVNLKLGKPLHAPEWSLAHPLLKDALNLVAVAG
jgi:mitochondrial FAD-linked sulfhydryl oxidase